MGSCWLQGREWAVGWQKQVPSRNKEGIARTEGAPIHASWMGLTLGSKGKQIGVGVQTSQETQPPGP